MPVRALAARLRARRRPPRDLGMCGVLWDTAESDGIGMPVLSDDWTVDGADAAADNAAGGFERHWRQSSVDVPVEPQTAQHRSGAAGGGSGGCGVG